MKFWQEIRNMNIEKIFKQDIDAIVIYASMPMGKIIGEFTIDGIINDNPMTVWKETKEYAGISFENYKKYFKGKREAYAICIKDLKIYENQLIRMSNSLVSSLHSRINI